jgi:hypothetical protein
MFSVFLNIYLGVVWYCVGWMLTLFNLLRNYQTVFQCYTTILHFYQQCLKILIFHTLTHTCYCLFLSGREVISLWFCFAFPQCWALGRIDVHGHLYIFMKKCLFRSFSHFKIRLCIFFYCWVVIVLYIFWI